MFEEAGVIDFDEFALELDKVFEFIPIFIADLVVSILIFLDSVLCDIVEIVSLFRLFRGMPIKSCAIPALERSGKIDLSIWVRVCSNRNGIANELCTYRRTTICFC